MVHYYMTTMSHNLHTFKVYLRNTPLEVRTATVCDLLLFHKINYYYYYYYYCVVLSSSLVVGIFFMVLLLNQRRSSPLMVQASHCSTSHIMCDVPSTADFCSEFIESFLGMASKFFFKPFVTTTTYLLTYLLHGAESFLSSYLVCS